MSAWNRPRLVGPAFICVGIAALAMDSKDVPVRCRSLTAPTGQQLKVSVARDAAKRAAGLSALSSPPYDGILLEWPTLGRHPIWMSDMRFDLDLLWLAVDGRVLAALSNVAACATGPCPIYAPAGSELSRAVLEIPAGRAAELKLSVGAHVPYVDTPLIRCDAAGSRSQHQEEEDA